MKKKAFWKQISLQKISFLFIAPTLILFLVFKLVPVFASFFLSFTKYNVLQPPVWIGLENYKNIIFNDERFWKSVWNTLYYVCVVVPFGIVISLFVAICLDQKIRFKNFFKAMFFMPYVTSVVAYSVVWRWLFAGEKYGLINNYLMKFGIQPIDWFMNPKLIMPAIMIMSIWAGFGFNMLLFLAGLQAIPNTFYEAAEIDGAGEWKKFWHITLPLLRPTMVFVVIMSTIASFQVFEQVYIMTAGTGGVGGVFDSALTIVAYMYDKGFMKFEMGYASAIAYILFAFIFILTIFNWKAIKPKTEY